MRGLKFWIFLAFVLYAFPNAFAAAVTARLDRDTIMVGDSAMLEIQIQNANPTVQPVFQPPPNLSIEYTGSGRQISIVNGQTTAAVKIGRASCRERWERAGRARRPCDRTR